MGALAALLALGCASRQPYIWAAEYAPKPAPTAVTAVLRPGDHVLVVVHGQDAMSGDFEVRPGGEIVVPIAGRVMAAGYSADAVAQGVAARLRGVIADPVVTAVVSARRASSVSVLGEVKTPGRYELRDEDGVMDELARAGGLTEFADGDAIFVVRRDLPSTRIRFRYRDLTKGDPKSVSFQLRDADVIVVE